jgi:hypothetical protein
VAGGQARAPGADPYIGVGWDTALHLVAEALRNTYARHGAFCHVVPWPESRRLISASATIDWLRNQST